MKVILFMALIGLLFYLVQKNSQSGIHICERCKGKGFWTGLRGERNNCKPCGGTGEIHENND